MNWWQIFYYALTLTMSLNHLEHKKNLSEERFFGALEKTWTSTGWANMHLKHARLPIPPPGHKFQINRTLYILKNFISQETYLNIRKNP